MFIQDHAHNARQTTLELFDMAIRADGELMNPKIWITIIQMPDMKQISKGI